MKRAINLLGSITLLFFFMAACDGQSSRTDTRDNLADVREDMREVIQDIDEALTTNDISEFKNKTDDAVSSLDNKLDDYLNEMDNADRRVDHNTRNQIIDMKQKKVEIEFKLALLEQDDYDNWDDRDSRQDQTGTGTDRRTGDVSSARQSTTGDDRTATGTRQTASVDDRAIATDTRQTATGDDRTSTDTRQTTTGDDRTTTGARTTDGRNQRREILYGPQLVDDMKNDLRDLKGNVEQFTQSLPQESVSK